MRKFYILVSAVLLSASLWGQAPQKMSYQAVIRGANNALVIDKPVGVRISILQGSETGSTVYTETHTPTTNANGLASLSIGAGKNPSSDFSKIDWSKGPYFVKTETDVEGGTNYQLTVVSELMSVPYALYAANSQPGPKGDKGDAGPQGPAGKNGVDGKNGLDGKDGLQGPQGLKGDTGLTGAQGSKGDIGAQGPAGKDGKVEFQNLKVSQTGDTLYLTNGNFVIIPGISLANPKVQPTSGYGSNITDLDGNSYKTVYIGSQQWMAENLKTSKYNDGSEITTITNSSLWSGSTTGATCYLNNDLTNVSKYGRLYNWNSISKSKNGNKNVCPVGWHVPSENEWVKLFDYLGGASVAGGKMKEVGTLTWSSPNTGATNTSLFTALPGGGRLYDIGDYYYVTGEGYWWSITESNSIEAKKISLFSNTATVSQSVSEKASGLSIRCLKD
jgi:uncharacterized protein (TIGR02145 family)